MSKGLERNLKEIMEFFPSRGSNSHFFSQHISNRGKEAYEFNIKCFFSNKPEWVTYEDHEELLENELTNFIFDIKERHEWIRECFQAGRSGGWLIITTYERILEDWEDSDVLVSEEEVEKRLKDLLEIFDEIREKINFFSSMTKEDAEDFWSFCKPENWEEIIRAEKERENRRKKERTKRQREVISYVPSDKFYMIETTHRKWLTNDRGDIISSFDKMKRNDRWGSYGQVPNNNPLLGWNRIVSFAEEGIAPKRVFFEEAFSKDIRGLSVIVRNAPTGNVVNYGEVVTGKREIPQEDLGNFNIEI